jgi:hypothetical protein
MFVKRTWAAFAAVLVLSLSLSGAVCDASCAFRQPHSDGTAMDQAACQHETKSGEDSLTIQAWSACHHRHLCADPANLPVQKLRPVSQQLHPVVLRVVAHLWGDDIFVARTISRLHDCRTLLANTPSTSLRI